MTGLPFAAQVDLTAAHTALRSAWGELSKAQHPAAAGVGATAHYIANLLAAAPEEPKT